MGFSTQAINTFGRLVMPVTNWGASPKGPQKIQRSGKNNHGTSTIFFRIIHKTGRIGSLFAMILSIAWSALHVNVVHAESIGIPGKVYWNAGNVNLFRTPEEACASPATGFDPAYWALDRVEPYDPNAVVPELYRCWYIKKSSGESGYQSDVGTYVICPAGFTPVGLGISSYSNSKCYGSWAIDPKNNGISKPKVCNPINPAVGNKFQIEQDYVGSGTAPLNFQRTYNSAGSLIGALGANWTFTYGQTLRLYSGYALAYRPDGKSIYFSLTEGVFRATGDVADTLRRVTNASGQVTSYEYISAENDEVEFYNVVGRLYAIKNRAGLSTTLAYSDGTTPISVASHIGLLIRINDTFGRQLNFFYDKNDRIIQMTDANGGKYLYTYDSRNNLSSVTYPDNKKRAYLYNEPAFTQGTNLISALTGVIDENGSRYATYRYEANGRAISTEHADGADKATLTYAAGSTTVLDSLGTSRIYYFQEILGVIKPSGQSQAGGSGCGPALSGIGYDANGNVTTQVDFNRNRTTYLYDLSRNLETSRIEASGTTQARTITTQWHATYRLPTVIAEPLRKTILTYDASGNLMTKTVQTTADVTGAQGVSATVVGATRAWTYTYNTVGQVLTIAGPRSNVNDLTTYAYDATGNLVTVTNALGHITTLSNYDANGRVGRIVNANGVTTDLTYSPRGWPTSRIVSGAGGTPETTSYQYDGVGQMTQIALPDSSSIGYTYDPAHRLTNIADSLGNSINYTLDAMGNRTSEQVKDPAGTLARQTTRIYDALNRLQQVIGGTQ